MNINKKERVLNGKNRSLPKKGRGLSAVALASLLFITTTGCSNNSNPTPGLGSDSSSTSEQSQSNTNNNAERKGKELTETLADTDWKTTRVYDESGTDLTAENSALVGLAKYDEDTGKYEFFDAQTANSSGDEGTFFITNDGKRRVLISATQQYQAVDEITKLTDDVFTYKRTGQNADGVETEVFVDHEPYDEEKLNFSTPDRDFSKPTGTIEDDKPGNDILGGTLWNGTKVIDEAGNDLTEQNANFISLAKFEANTSQYGFFNLETGESRGDYGYYAVLNDNRIRAHVSIGTNKYGAALELTELNNDKFTYKRTGKDANGNDVTIFVEHEPYTGSLSPTLPEM